MTTDTNARRARGYLTEKTAESIVFTTLDSEYRLHLTTLSEVRTEPGDRIVGTIRLQAATRFSIVSTGGRYIEPLYGQPRRIQGTVVEIDAGAGTITVNAAIPIVVALTDLQKPTDFEIGQLVGGGVRSNASFSLAGA